MSLNSSCSVNCLNCLFSSYTCFVLFRPIWSVQYGIGQRNSDKFCYLDSKQFKTILDNSEQFETFQLNLAQLSSTLLSSASPATTLSCLNFLLLKPSSVKSSLVKTFPHYNFFLLKPSPVKIFSCENPLLLKVR